MFLLLPLSALCHFPMWDGIFCIGNVCRGLVHGYFDLVSALQTSFEWAPSFGSDPFAGSAHLSTLALSTGNRLMVQSHPSAAAFYPQQALAQAEAPGPWFTQASECGLLIYLPLCMVKQAF